MKLRIIALLSTLLVALSVAGEEPVRLVVNVVVSGIREVDLERYEKGFRAGGFERLLSGERYSSASYGFIPTTPSALATLSTGALPSMHGIVGEGWWNYTSGNYTLSVGDNSYSTFDSDSEESRVSNSNLIFETIGDVVVRSVKGAKSVSVATTPSSAIILGGLEPSEVWWIDSLGGRWTTSTKYKTSLPKWVAKYNSAGYLRNQLGAPWVLSRPDKDFVNERGVVVKPYGYKQSKDERKKGPTREELKSLIYSHVTNSMVAEFAKEAIIYNRLGGDGVVDVLNVCFDSPRKIAERYGLDSREMEDMYYRLDEQLADLLTFASAQASGKILFTLTTDGGIREVKSPSKIFNVAQARFLINSFLSATYGKSDWVLGYEKGGVWLNHTLIFSRGLDLVSLQRQVATFALGMRGVSHAVVATDMMAGDAKEGVVAMVQRGFNPKRSADVNLVLMPDWCESENGEVPLVSYSQPYAPYRRAIVALCGTGVESREIDEEFDVRSLVTILAKRLGVELPLGAE